MIVSVFEVKPIQRNPTNWAEIRDAGELCTNRLVRNAIESQDRIKSVSISHPVNDMGRSKGSPILVGSLVELVEQQPATRCIVG